MSDEPKLTGDIWVGAVRFSEGVDLSTVQAAINRALQIAIYPDDPRGREQLKRWFLEAIFPPSPDNKRGH